MTVSTVARLQAALRDFYAAGRRSSFVRNSLIVTAISGVERVAAVVQTVLIARALGIIEYGIYGLLFTTIGFVASVVGMQMGLTATVLVARYRVSDKARAGAVIRHVTRFSLLAALAFLLVSVPFAQELSQRLFRTEGYAVAVVLGSLFIGATLLSGVQDGVAQGFEDFGAMARARLFSAVLSLAMIFPAAKWYGLDGVVLAIFAGVALKLVMLERVVAAHRRREQIPRSGGDLSFGSMVMGFSLPSMLVSMLVGAATWYGSYLLSRQPEGFAGLALVNTGLQWRGPVLLVAASMGSVAVPVFSRYAASSDPGRARWFQRRLVWLNAAGASLVTVLLVLLARPLLSLYGAEFPAGAMVFSLLVATTVPTVVANVYMQQLVGSGRLWTQFFVQLPYVAAMMLGFVLLVPRMQGLGYALALVASTLVFAVSAGWLHWRGVVRSRRSGAPG